MLSYNNINTFITFASTSLLLLFYYYNFFIASSIDFALE